MKQPMLYISQYGNGISWAMPSFYRIGSHVRRYGYFVVFGLAQYKAAEYVDFLAVAEFSEDYGIAFENVIG
jgi:hypothetical protein